MSDLVMLGAVLFAFGTSVYGYIKARSHRRTIEQITRQMREANAYLEGFFAASNHEEESP